MTATIKASSPVAVCARVAVRVRAVPVFVRDVVRVMAGVRDGVERRRKLGWTAEEPGVLRFPASGMVGRASYKSVESVGASVET